MQALVQTTVLADGPVGPLAERIQLALTFKHEQQEIGSLKDELAAKVGSHLTGLTDEVGEQTRVTLGEGETFLVCQASAEGGIRLKALGTVDSTTGDS